MVIPFEHHSGREQFTARRNGTLANRDPQRARHLDRAQLSVTTEGTKLSEWLDNSQLALAMDKAEVTWGYGAQLSIDKARLNAGLHVPFHSNIQGQLMGVPVNIDAQAGNLQDIMLERDWPAA